MVLLKLMLKPPPAARCIAAGAMIVAILSWIIRPGLFVQAADNPKPLHDLHVKDQGLTCKDCHVEPLPVNQDACQDCHDAADVEKLFSSFVLDVSRSGSPQPPDHTQDWRRTHGVVAALDPGQCSSCHELRSCQDCHEGENVQAQIHPLNFRRTHSFEAKSHEQDCLVCHESRDYCVECHRLNMVLPHPLGPSWASDEGGAHAEEAEADLESCLDCHDMGSEDPVCARLECHGSRGDD